MRGLEDIAKALGGNLDQLNNALGSLKEVGKDAESHITPEQKQALNNEISRIEKLKQELDGIKNTK